MDMFFSIPFFRILLQDVPDISHNCFDLCVAQFVLECRHLIFFTFFHLTNEIFSRVI